MTTATQLLERAEVGDAEGLRDEFRYQALTSLYYFSKVVLGYMELSPHLHLEFCRYIESTHHLRNRGILMPRGHFKSTIVSKSYPLWRLLTIAPSLLVKYPDLINYKHLHNPDTRIVIVGESSTVASKNLKDIKHNLLTNQMLQWLFPEIIPPDINDTVWRETEILLPRSRSYDESSITSLGVGDKTTGKHWDLIIYDDLIGEKASKSEAEMEAAKHWFAFAPGLANNPATVEESYIGTRWKAGAADIYGHVMATLPSDEDANSAQVDRVNDDGQRLGGFVWYIRSALEPDPDTGEMAPIFPERFTVETLNAIRKREGEYFFSCNYLNDPLAEGVADFNLEWIQEYSVADDYKTLTPLDDSPPVILAQLNRISFFDPSSGGHSAKCEGAIVAVGEDAKLRKFLLDYKAGNLSYGQHVENWYLLNDKFKFYRNYYEQVGAQKAVEDIVFLRNELIRRGQPCVYCGAKHQQLRIEPFIPPGGIVERHKDDRIRSFLQADAEGRRIYTRVGMHHSFRKQLSEFPHGQLKDILDAAAAGFHLLIPPREWEDIEQDKKAEEKMRVARARRTHTTVDYGGY